MRHWPQFRLWASLLGAWGGMSSRNYLRLGIILAVSGLIALGHYALTSHGHLSPQATLIIGIVLVVAGAPLLVVGVRKRSGKL